MTRRRDWRVAVALAFFGPALLAFHTLVYCASVDVLAEDSWRRLWNDLALATADWVEATYGPAPAEVRGAAADRLTRELLRERVLNQGMSATRPLERVRKPQFFVEAGLRPEPSTHDDRGRAVLLALAFRVRGGILPFMILWLGFLVAAPVVGWTAVELWAAGRFRGAAGASLLLGLSPFLLETLALARYPVGFYLVAVLVSVPLAVYARLHPAPTLVGLCVRLFAAAGLLALCTFCRSSAAVLLPGFVLAAWLGSARVTRTPGRRIALTAVAAVLLGLPSALVPRAQQNDLWQPVWEGLGDFDRTHVFTWDDAAALRDAQQAGATSLWTPESEAVFRRQVVDTIVTEPGWYAGILARRLLTTVSLWRLWPWGPRDGSFIRRHDSPNEGVIDKYWTYTTPADHLGIGEYVVELPVSLLLAPTLLLAVLACRGKWATPAREALLVLACPAAATLFLPVLVTTAGGQEGQALALVYLLAPAFLADVLRAGGSAAPEDPPGPSPERLARGSVGGSRTEAGAGSAGVTPRFRYYQQDDHGRRRQIESPVFSTGPVFRWERAPLRVESDCAPLDRSEWQRRVPGAHRVVMVRRPADRLRLEIIDAGRRLHDQGLIAASQGNISVRSDHGLLVTAAGVSKGSLTPRLVLRTDMDGRAPGPGVSSEIQMHVATYRRRPDVKAIVHAHPPAATAFASAGTVPDSALLAESILLLGRVRLVPYAAPSTAALANLVGEALMKTQAVLLANHGAVTVGATLTQAMNRMESLEHLARVTLLARVLGKPRPLPAREVARLLALTSAPYR